MGHRHATHPRPPRPAGGTPRHTYGEGPDPWGSGPSRCSVCSLGEPALQDLQFVPHGAGELVAELSEPLGDLGDLLPPLLRLDREGLLDLLGAQVEARNAQRVARGDMADRGLDAGRRTLEALYDPLEHAAVLTE